MRFYFTNQSTSYPLSSAEAPDNKNPAHCIPDIQDPDAAEIAGDDWKGYRRCLYLPADDCIDNQRIQRTEGCMELWKVARSSHSSKLDSKGIVMAVGWAHNTSSLPTQEGHSLGRKWWSDGRESNLARDETETRDFVVAGCIDRVGGIEQVGALPDTWLESTSFAIDLQASCHNSVRPYSALHAYQRAFLD